jgi:Mor family transcriptional regulator
VNLPIDELVAAIGLPAALRLAEAFGGRRIYLPRPGHIVASHALPAAIGIDAANALCAQWPSTYAAVPFCADRVREMRDRAVWRARAELTVRELAEKFQTTERTIYRILEAPPPGEDEAAAASTQPQLF